MPEQRDDRTPDEAEGRLRAFLAQEEHRHNKPKKPTHQDDLVADVTDEPDWHKAGRTVPPGWAQHGDTFVED